MFRPNIEITCSGLLLTSIWLKQAQPKVCVKPDIEPYTDDFPTEQDSLFDEDIEQIQVCDVKQAAMETEFETFSELMTEKESLLDEDLDKLDVRDTKRQSLESEFEAYSMVLEERKSYLNEETVCQKAHARTLEMTSHFEPFTELMEGEETLLRESLEKLEFSTKTEFVSSGDHLHVIPTPISKVSTSLDSPPVNQQSESFPVQSVVGVGSSKRVSEHQGPRSSILEDISHQVVGPTTEVKIKESLVLSEGSELNLSGLDILQVYSSFTDTGASQTFSRG